MPYIIVAEDNGPLADLVLTHLQTFSELRHCLLITQTDPEEILAAMAAGDIIILDGSVFDTLNRTLQDLKAHDVILFTGDDNLIARAHAAGVPAFSKTETPVRELIRQEIIPRAVADLFHVSGR